MDAEFIQSVAHVGDNVEISLVAGSRFEGILTELTLSRLVLRVADGRVVAVALPSIVTIMQTMQTEPAPAPIPALVPVDPLSVSASAPAPIAVPAAAASVPADMDSVNGLGRKHTNSSESGSDNAAKALAAVSALSNEPIEMDIFVAPQDRNRLQQVRNSYGYAAKINELDPRYGRIGPLYQRTLLLWNADQGNAELTRLVGALALLRGDVETAHCRFAQAADSGDVSALRLLAVTAAKLGDANTSLYGLLRFFHAVAPDSDPSAWEALLALLDARNERGQLGGLLDSASHDEVAREAVRLALGNASPQKTAMERPPGAVPQPRSMPLVRQTRTPLAVPVLSTRPGPPRRATNSGRQYMLRGQDPYQVAKFLEHRIKDLRGAQDAYRKAINKNVRRESAVKDLASLTKRLDGSEAALRVIEREYPGMVQPGNALDNILIDFLPGARRYAEALDALHRQHSRPDITSSRRYHLEHQIAYVKLAGGHDSTADWRRLVDQSPDNPAFQRGLAMALIQLDTTEGLDEAERLIALHTDERATGIRDQIATLRQGGEIDPKSTELLELLLLADAQLSDPTPPLVTYVMQNFSDLATRAKDQGERESKIPTRDLVNVTAEMGRQMAGKQPENSARAYISAAVLARELGEDAQRYLYSGLTTLAEVVLGRQEQDSARDLYCAALAAADAREDSDSPAEVQAALIGYLRLLGGRPAAVGRRRDRDASSRRRTDTDVAKVLVEELNKHGYEVFNLIPPLLADTSVARDLVLDAVCSRPDLLDAVAKHLSGIGVAHPKPEAQAVRAGWQHAVEQWNLEQRRLAHSLAELRHLAVSENLLESALKRLVEQEDKTPKPLQEALGRIKQALSELRRYISEPSYEERANCLRLAGSAAKALRADVARGPTNLAVELVEPVAERIQTLVAETQAALDVNQAPQPELGLALEQSSASQDGMVTVQIKVSNAPWRAPLDSPELTINVEPELFSVDEATIPLATSVRGGASRIQPVKLRVTDLAMRSGAFSVPVTLHYRSRSSDEFVRYEATLPVRLAREEEFEEIRPNPFQDGASGRPVENKKMFYGRDDLINQISERLGQATSPGIGVAVFGQKRAGKSSIRLHLTQRLREEGLYVVDVGNIGDLSPESGDLTGTRLLALLMWRILDGANDALHSVGTSPLIPEGLDRVAFLASPEPVHDCAKLIEQHRAALPVSARPMTVLIDEFQYIDQWIRMGLLSPSFMQAFKALIERRLFHLVIVGQAALDRLIKADPNVFGVFLAERVTYLSFPDARRLIEEPIYMPGPNRRISRYRERAVDQILDLTGGSAFYIQRFCYQLVEYMNTERAPVVTEADVEQIRETFLDSLEAKDFDGLESPGYTETDAFTSEQYRSVLLAVARASRSQPAVMPAIRNEYQGPRLQELLDDLVMRDVVRRDSGAYRIVVQLYRDWLLKNFGTSSAANAV